MLIEAERRMNKQPSVCNNKMPFHFYRKLLCCLGW